MPRTGANISLTSYDDIFTTEAGRAEETTSGERVQEILLTQMHPFRNHPFKILDNEEMVNMVESIMQFGVLTPAIARPLEEGGYEIISGHRRHHAAELAGLTTIPVIVRDLDDDAATILMVDSNLQREDILPSERAFSFKMKLEAIKHQGQRTSVQVAPKLSTAIIGEESGMSKDNVKRYIRLTNLIPELMDMVDNKQVAFNPAVELSYLAKEEQQIFMDVMESEQCPPSLSQAQRIKKLSQEGNCTFESMSEIMGEEKKADLDRVTIKNEVLKKYFPKSYTPKQMENTIIKLLEQWQKKKQREEML
jgi:ParB family chromosome partitioning protein